MPSATGRRSLWEAPRPSNPSPAPESGGPLNGGPPETSYGRRFRKGGDRFAGFIRHGVPPQLVDCVTELWKTPAAGLEVTLSVWPCSPAACTHADANLGVGRYVPPIPPCRRVPYTPRSDPVGAGFFSSRRQRPASICPQLVGASSLRVRLSNSRLSSSFLKICSNVGASSRCSASKEEELSRIRLRS